MALSVCSLPAQDLGNTDEHRMSVRGIGGNLGVGGWKEWMAGVTGRAESLV